jgi:signal recognition particle receptor subunit beta
MASVNALARELVFKIVYYGPGLGGKTTTLEHLHATAKPEHRGKLVSLATPVDRTLYFDFLPMRLPPLRGMNIRLQLFTVPGQVYFNATRKLVLTGADGIVFVSDSQVARADANVESLENLRENLALQGRELAQVPLVFQHNKRDLPDVLPVEELDSILNPWGVPSIPTCAREGTGVYEALQKICEETLKSFEAKLPELSDSPAEASFQAIEGGLAMAIRDVSPSPSRDDIIVARMPDPNDTFPSMASEAASEAEQNEPATEVVPLEPPEPAEPLPVTMKEQSGLRLALGSPRGSAEGVSFAELWPQGEQALVLDAEAAIAEQAYARAALLCEELVARALARAEDLLGPSERPRDPAVVPVLLGLSGARYLKLRAWAREARGGNAVPAREALAAFAFAIDAQLASSAVP